MYEKTVKLIDMVSEKNPLQDEYLHSVFNEVLTPEEKASLEGMIEVLENDCSLEYLSSSYLMLINDTMKETKYFLENGSYRYSTLDEVRDKVYSNEEYMTKYMTGLMLSGYLWQNHVAVNRWYREKLKTLKGRTFLEIGPGHGQYFLEAVRAGSFDEYLGVDLSESSVKLARRNLEKKLQKDHKPYRLICADIFDAGLPDGIDAVVLSEVLEHVEDPRGLLERIYEISSDKASVYISVPINAPEIDHIYLFRSNEEVFKLAEEAGFSVSDSFYVTSNGVSYEKALKKKIAVNLALLLKKGD